ncbi:MAG TPA: sensor histidine kinase [Janthinobacterium sp.]|nr:sensor histidine kinase [Janthinobacterium sp.]
MRLRSHRFILAASLGCAIASRAATGLALRDDEPWSEASHVDILAAAAVLLAVIAMLLLWRQQRLSTKLDYTNRQLADEHRLRSGAELALLDTHANLCKLVALQDGIKESERQRIGRDIHDDLGQNLLALKIDVCMLHLSTASAAPAVHQKLGLIAANIDLTVQSLRRIIHDLRPLSLEAGLKAALEWQLGEFTRVHGIPHELDASQDAFEAGRGVELIIFRILQESLSNIARHARARSVRVTLSRHAGSLLMTVRDDGVGLPAGQFRRGCGLTGIEDRISAAGGRLMIASQPGQGTALSLSIPLNEAQAAG